jgi:hypothetical protein
VTGTVTYNNNPLTFGSVSVMGDDGLTQATHIGKDGSYRFGSVVTGPAKFVVVCLDPKEAELRRQAIGRGGADGQARGRQRAASPSPDPGESKGSLIPLHYGDFSKTDLKYTVTSGTNKFDIKLKNPEQPAGGKEP